MSELRKSLQTNPARAPGAFTGAVGIELGKLLEFETNEGLVVRPKRGVELLWFPTEKALAFFEGAKESRASAKVWGELEGSKSKKAKTTFRKWADRDSKKARRIDFTSKSAKWSRSPQKLARIDYRSDKWGETAEYTHDTGRSVGIYLLAGARGPAFWLFMGGSLRVTARGIEG